MASTFQARYSGPCAAECGVHIAAGDEVRFVDDELMHAGCADREDQPDQGSARRETPCSECHMVHAGECM